MDEVTKLGADVRRDLGLLTEEEVAAAFKRNLMTIRNWRGERRGPPFVKMGHEVFYRVEAVRRHLAESETATEPLDARA